MEGLNTEHRVTGPRRRRLAASLTTLVCLVMMGIGAAPAQAAPTLAQLLNKARVAREARRYDEALEALLQAYNLAPEPALLFNIGKLYQDQGDCKNSLEYMLQAFTTGSAAAKVNKDLLTAIRNEVATFSCAEGPETTVARLEARKDEIGGVAYLRLGQLYQELGQCDVARTFYLDANRLADVGDDVSKAAIGALKDFECTPRASAIVHTPPDEVGPEEGPPGEGPAIDEGATLRWAGYGLVGLGAATLLTALVIDIDTLGTIDGYDAAAQRGDAQEYDRLKADAEAGMSLAVLLYGTGAVIAATGAVLWVLGLPDDGESSKTVQLAPSFGELTGATLQVTW